MFWLFAVLIFWVHSCHALSPTILFKDYCRNCRNAHFTCIWQNSNLLNNTSQVQQVGNRIQFLVMVFCESIDPESLFSLWGPCSCVGTLALHEKERGTLASVLSGFGTEKRPSLQLLQMTFVERVNAQELRLVGLWTGSLKELTITLRPANMTMLECLNGLDKVAVSNPFLKNLHIKLHLGESPRQSPIPYGNLVAESDMAHIVRSLSVCPVLDCVRLPFQSSRNVRPNR